MAFAFTLSSHFPHSPFLEISFTLTHHSNYSLFVEENIIFKLLSFSNDFSGFPKAP